MGRLSDADIFRKTLVAAAAVATAVILWKLIDLILLLAASALVAFIFYKFGMLLQRRLRLPFALAIILAVILPLLFLVAAFGIFGTMMAAQFTILAQQLPHAVEAVERWLQTTTVGRQLLAHAETFMPEGARVIAFMQELAGGVGTALTALVVILVAGVYLAAQPRLYGSGVLHMLPPARRQRAREVAAAVANSLSAWLRAQGLSMLFIGVFTSVALAIIGIPAAPALGIIAGLCEFIPYLGTIMVALPAIILGFTQSTEAGIWTFIAIVAIQQIQGNIVTPLIQSHVAELPPALTIFSLFAFGILMGPMGVILAAPLTMVAMALVRELLVYPDDRKAETPPSHQDR